MLKLSSPVTLNNYIQIACLPPVQSTTYPGVGVTVYAVGFQNQKVTYVKLTIYPAANCSYTSYFDAGMICSGEY